MQILEYAYELICPLCGSRMRLKLNHKTGQKFFGCSAYPECKQTFSVVDAEARLCDYTAYLQSPEWVKKRDKALKKAEYKCQLCNRKDKVLHVHHRTYEHIGEEERHNDLVVLCSECHAKFHDK